MEAFFLFRPFLNALNWTPSLPDRQTNRQTRTLAAMSVTANTLDTRSPGDVVRMWKGVFGAASAASRGASRAFLLTQLAHNLSAVQFRLNDACKVLSWLRHSRLGVQAPKMQRKTWNRALQMNYVRLYGHT